MKGKVLIFSAPSGSGKTTLVKHLLQTIDNLQFSVSATSRAPRMNEVNGKDYFFITADEFRSKINNNEFLEWQEVYEGVYYGSLASVVDNMLSQWINVIFDVDVIGGINIKKHYGSQALSFFVKVKSLDVIRERLFSRSTDSEESIKKRLDKAEWELGFEKDFDVALLNDNLETAKAEVYNIATDFINKWTRFR